MDNIEDPTNITGLSPLFNKKHIDEKLDLDRIEKSMIGGNIVMIDEDNPDTEYKNIMKELSSDTGIMFEPDQEAVEIVDDDDFNGDLNPFPEPEYEYAAPPPSRQSHQSRQNPYFGTQFQSFAPYQNPQNPQNPQYQNYPHQPQNAAARNIDDALQKYMGGNFAIERVRVEDTKAILLEDIDELISELERDEVDLSRIPVVNQDSPIGIVRKIHKILRMKYDRRRCNTLGKEIILAGAQGLEYLCDGNREIGPFQPDLTGWHNTVRAKLNRMRYETSTIVATLMHEYNIGPTARVLMELVPSMVLYSHMKKENFGRATYSPAQMSEAYDELAQFDKNS